MDNHGLMNGNTSRSGATAPERSHEDPTSTQNSGTNKSIDTPAMSEMKISITNSAIFTVFGTKELTVNGLLRGKSAVVPSTSFGCDVSLAEFPDSSFRNPQILAKQLQSQLPDLNRYDSPETLFIFAAAKGSLDSIESKNGIPQESLLQNQAEQFAGFLGLNHCTELVISNACASGIAAIDTACDYLNHKLFRTVIIAGFDLISEFTVTGFNSLGAISPTGARPFDKDRSGMTLGEGAGLLILKQKEVQPGDIVISGSATSNDANHRTGPSRDGSGLALAISSALNSAEIAPAQIGAIKCHGTATPYNDAMESKALFTIFGNNQPPAVSFKGNIGHLSGAGSLIETILAAEFLKRKLIPGTFGFESTECEEPIRISAHPQSFELPAIAVLAAGFGGLNASVILEEIQ